MTSLSSSASGSPLQGLCTLQPSGVGAQGLAPLPNPLPLTPYLCRRLRRACGESRRYDPPLQGLRTLQPRGVGAQGLAPLPNQLSLTLYLCRRLRRACGGMTSLCSSAVWSPLQGLRTLQPPGVGAQGLAPLPNQLSLTLYLCRRLRRACGGMTSLCSSAVWSPLQGLCTLQPSGVGAQSLAPLPNQLPLPPVSQPQAAESLRRNDVAKLLRCKVSAAGSLHPAASGRRGARPCAPTESTTSSTVSRPQVAESLRRNGAGSRQSGDILSAALFIRKA